MLTPEEARLQVQLELQRRYGLRSGPEELAILDEHTIKRSWGWVFFYTTKGWRDGDLQYALAGNGPILVNRADGSMVFCGSAYPAEYYIEEYETQLGEQNLGGG